MNEERKKILEMLANGKITPDTPEVELFSSDINSICPIVYSIFKYF